MKITRSVRMSVYQHGTHRLCGYFDKEYDHASIVTTNDFFGPVGPAIVEEMLQKLAKRGVGIGKRMRITIETL